MALSHYEKTFEERLEESRKVKLIHPDRVCIYLEKHKNTTSLPNIDKNKYLVPLDLTMGQFMFIIRKRINLGPENAIFFIANNSILIASTTIAQLHEKHKDPDGFIYLKYTAENCFGA